MTVYETERQCRRRRRPFQKVLAPSNSTMMICGSNIPIIRHYPPVHSFLNIQWTVLDDDLRHLQRFIPSQVPANKQVRWMATQPENVNRKVAIDLLSISSLEIPPHPSTQSEESEEN